MARPLIRGLFIIVLAIECYLLGLMQPRPVHPPVMDTELQTYLNLFEAEAQKRGVTVDRNELGLMVYMEGMGSISGYCNPNYGIMRNIFNSKTGGASIFIDEEFRTPHNLDYAFTSLVFHELGHCLLGLDHDNKECKTIMSDSKMPTPGTPEYDELNEYNREHWRALLDDLFTRPKLALPPKEFCP